MSELNVDVCTVEQIKAMEYSVNTASLVMLGALAINFAHIERVPRYNPEQRENDAEHSFMLAFIAPELASKLRPELDENLIQNYAIYHDLIELVTDDVATFNITDAALAKKNGREHHTLPQLMSMLPVRAREMVSRYEQQADPESRWVRAVDKLLPAIVDIIGPGAQVMREDYGVTTLKDLQEAGRRKHARFQNNFGEEFPALVSLHHEVCRLFEYTFSQEIEH